MPAPCAKELDRLIAVGKMVQTPDAEGGLVESFVEEQKVWAKVRNHTGSEHDLTSNGGVGYSSKTIFTVRYTPSITHEHGVMFEGEYYDIQKPELYQGKREWLQLIAVSNTADGR